MVLEAISYCGWDVQSTQICKTSKLCVQMTPKRLLITQVSSDQAVELSKRHAAGADEE